MCRFIPSNRLDLGVRVFVKASLLEVFDGELLECLTIECVLEVLESESVVENITCGVLKKYCSKAFRRR